MGGLVFEAAVEDAYESVGLGLGVLGGGGRRLLVSGRRTLGLLGLGLGTERLLVQGVVETPLFVRGGRPRRVAA